MTLPLKKKTLIDMNSVHNKITLKVIANCLLMCTEIVSFLSGYWKGTDQRAFRSPATSLLQCSFATTGGRCFTAHSTANGPAKCKNKTKQWDTVLKFKTSQDKSIVVVYHADVKMKPDPAETL